MEPQKDGNALSAVSSLISPLPSRDFHPLPLPSIIQASATDDGHKKFLSSDRP